MKKALALLLALLALSGCAAKGDTYVLLSSGPASPAAAALAEAAGGATAQALSDRAALEQLSLGNCEFAVVCEASLRSALNGDGGYNGNALDNLERLDDLLLGAFCVFAKDEPERWTKGMEVLTLTDGGPGEELANTLCGILGLENVRAVDRDEAEQAVKDQTPDAVMGLFLPGEQLIETLTEQGYGLKDTGEVLEAPQGYEGSMALETLPPLYDGMPRMDALCLYGALVASDTSGEEARAALLRASADQAFRAQRLPDLP